MKRLTRRLALGSFALIPAALMMPQRSHASRVDPGPTWAVVYASEVPRQALAPYDLLILDSDGYPPLAPLLRAGKTVLGYISLGEVNIQRQHFATVEGYGLFRGENPNWPGSQFVDLRDTRWHTLVLETLVPRILARGFSGLFLDTLDNAAYLEWRDPVANAGMTDAAATLVRKLRASQPDMPIMLNRAYEILPAVAGDIDMEMAESIRTDFDFATKTYAFVEEEEYRRQVELLNAVRTAHPDLQIMSLDYWYPADTETIRKIYRIQRENGFLPYVSTVELDRVIPEPPAR